MKLQRNGSASWCSVCGKNEIPSFEERHFYKMNLLLNCGMLEHWSVNKFYHFLEVQNAGYKPYCVYWWYLCINRLRISIALHKLKTRIIFKSMAATTTVAANISSSASNWICFSSNSSLIFLFSSMFFKMISFWLCVLFSSSRSLLSSWSHLFSVKILFKVFKKCFTERP